MLKYPLRILLLAIPLVLSATNCSIVAGSYYAKDGGSRPAPSTTTPRTPGKVPATAEARLREDIAEYARKYLGTKYRDAGKKPSSGFDCSGFTGYVMSKFDIPLAGSSANQSKEGRKVNPKNVAPGDLIFFRRSSREAIFHVALVLSNDKDGIYIIHSTSSRGVVIDNLTLSDYWRPKIDSARSVVGR